MSAGSIKLYTVHCRQLVQPLITVRHCKLR